jgi:hypothetical protein
MLRCLFLLTLAHFVVLADTTVRYEMDFKAGQSLPIPARDMDRMKLGLPMKMSFAFKNGDMYTNFRDLTMINRKGTQEFIAVSHTAKAFTKTSKAEWMEMNKMFGQAGQDPKVKEVLDSLKMTIDGGPTPNHPRVNNLDTDETSMVLRFTMDQPNMPDELKKMLGQMEFRMLFWTASDSEMSRHPERKEMQEAMAAMQADADMMKSFEQMFAMIPGAGAAMGDFMKKFQNKLMVGMRGGLHMPGLAALMRMAGQGENKTDPEGPLMEMFYEMKEFSAAPVNVADYEIPKGYRSVSLDDFRGLMGQGSGAAAEAAAKKAPAPAKKSVAPMKKPAARPGAKPAAKPVAKPVAPKKAA